MATIKAIIRNGRIEVAEPIDLPDGTELTIPLPGRAEILGIREEDGSDNPEAIAAWLAWYDALEPLDFSSEERVAREAARREEKQVELAQWEKRSQLIEKHFP
jgi:hypothetical protein